MAYNPYLLPKKQGSVVNIQFVNSPSPIFASYHIRQVQFTSLLGLGIGRQKKKKNYDDGKNV